MKYKDIFNKGLGEIKKLKSQGKELEPFDPVRQAKRDFKAKTVIDIKDFQSEMGFEEIYNKMAEIKKLEKETEAAKLEIKEITLSLHNNIRKQGKFERGLAKHHRRDLILQKRIEEAKRKRNEKSRNWEGVIPKVKSKLPEWKLTVADWKAAAFRSILEGADIWKKKTINSELDKLQDKLKRLEEELRKSINLGGDQSNPLPLRVENDKKSLYGSPAFEMPQFSKVTEDHLRELVEKRSPSENEMNADHIKKEVKEFQEYFSKVSKLRYDERRNRVAESFYQIQGVILKAEIQKLRELADCMQTKNCQSASISKVNEIIQNKEKKIEEIGKKFDDRQNKMKDIMSKYNELEIKHDRNQTNENAIAEASHGEGSSGTIGEIEVVSDDQSTKNEYKEMILRIAAEVAGKEKDQYTQNIIDAKWKDAGITGRNHNIEKNILSYNRSEIRQKIMKKVIEVKNVLQYSIMGKEGETAKSTSKREEVSKGKTDSENPAGTSTFIQEQAKYIAAIEAESREKNKELLREKQGLEDRVKNLNQEKQAWQSEKQGLEDRVKNLDQEKQAWQSEKQGLEDRVENLNQEKQAWQSEKQGLEDRVENLDQEKQAWQSEKQGLEDRVKNLDQEKQAWQSEKQGLEDRVENLDQEKQAWQQKSTELERANEGLKREKEELRQAREGLQKENTELEQTNKVLQDRTIELEQTNKVLQDRTIELEQTNEVLGQRIAELEQTNKVLQDRTIELEQTNEVLGQRIAELEQVNEGLKREKEELRQAEEKLENKDEKPEQDKKVLDSWNEIQDQYREVCDTLEKIDVDKAKKYLGRNSKKFNEKIILLSEQLDTYYSLIDETMKNFVIKEQDKERFGNLCKNILEINDGLEVFDHIHTKRGEVIGSIQSIDDKLNRGYLPQKFNEKFNLVFESQIQSLNVHYDSIRQHYKESFSVKKEDVEVIEASHHKLQEMNKDLDRLHQFQEYQKDINKFAQKEYRIIVEQWVNKEVGKAMKAYEKILEEGQQVRGESLASEHLQKSFNEACHQLKEKAGELEDAWKDQIEFYIDMIRKVHDRITTIYDQLPKEHFEWLAPRLQNFDETYQKYLKRYEQEWKYQMIDIPTGKPDEWRKQFKEFFVALDHHLFQERIEPLVRLTFLQKYEILNDRWNVNDKYHCNLFKHIGDKNIFLNIDQKTHLEMEKYMKDIEELRNQFSVCLQQGEHSEAGKCVDRLASRKEEFENYLRERRWLEETASPRGYNAQTPDSVPAEPQAEISLTSSDRTMQDGSSSNPKNDESMEGSSTQTVPQIAEQNKFPEEQN